MKMYMKCAMLTKNERVVCVTDLELLKLAESEGFSAAVIATADVPVDGKFRKFCEDNLCGQYNANYSCPPTCGTVEQMHEKILAGDKALVLKSEWPIESYQDVEAITKGKDAHNAGMLRLKETLQKEGYRCLVVGGSCCSLCKPCRMAKGEVCTQPDMRFSCLSAYCVDVADLANRCGMEFAWDTKKLYPYGMIVLSQK